MKLGDRVKECREHEGLSQDQLGDAIGQKQQTIGKIEDGTTQNPRQLKAIARVLKVSEAYLRFGIDPPPWKTDALSPSPEDEELLTEAQYLIERELILQNKSLPPRNKAAAAARLYLTMKHQRTKAISNADVNRIVQEAINRR